VFLELEPAIQMPVTSYLFDITGLNRRRVVQFGNIYSTWDASV